MRYIVLIISITVISFSCQKEVEDVAGFKYLDIEDAYGIVLGRYTSGSDTLARFFKINTSDNLEEVKYLRGDKREVYTNRTPVAIYPLDKTFFLVTYQFGSQNVKESYLVRRFDGSIQKLPVAVVPEEGGMDDNIIRHDNNSCFYFRNNEGNWKVDYRNSLKPLISEILEGEDLGNRYVVDYLGNILSDRKVYQVNGTATLLQNANTGYTFPVNSFINKMYYLHRNGDSVQCSQLDVSADPVTEIKLLPSFRMNEEEAGFIGSHAFADFNKIVVVFSKAILQIEDNKIQQIELGKLNLKKITACSFSGKYYFLVGENAIDSKVFVRVDPSATNTVYTQIMAPGETDISYFSASAADNLIFSGIRLKDSKKIFGYFPFNGNNWILDDDTGINEIGLTIR